MNKSEGTCANCGKGEEASINLKSCAACKLVKYCSRDCQIAHRPQHKKECKKRAAELHDEKLFEQPPPLDDCPICMVRLPYLESGSVYMNCCGKVACGGCIYTLQNRDGGVGLCPFCRTPAPTSKEDLIPRYKKRMEVNDAQAFHEMGIFYVQGSHGLPQYNTKALELLQRAGELGDAQSYSEIGYAYKKGRGVEKDEKKAIQYTKLAAMSGSVNARHNLGATEGNLGNNDRAVKHWMIAVKDGNSDSLKCIKALYSNGHATKDDYANALRSYQAYLDEIKTDQRDDAAAFTGGYKYYESGF